MAVSECKRNLVRKRIIENTMTIEQIAQEAGVSKNTVLRIKKEIPSNVLATHETGDSEITFDTTTLYTKAEEKYIRNIQKDAYLYEDAEEGWTFHLDKENFILKTSGLWWSFVAYPESVPEGWIEKLEHSGLAFAISPLHDKDKWLHDSPKCVNPETGEIIPKGARYKAGDKKKAHWHGIIIASSSTSFKEMNNLIRSITNGPYIQKCRSIKLAYDYFTHETDNAKKEGKYRYDRDEIITGNNFHIVPNKYEIGVLQCEITKVVVEKNLDDISKVAEYYKDMPEIMTLLWAKPGFITSLVRSNWRRNHPESKVQLTHEVTRDEYKEIKGE